MLIKGVNKKQRKTLDIICSFDDLEELYRWINSLPKRKRPEAKSLMELVALAIIDDAVDELTEFPDANKILRKIMANEPNG